MISRLVVDFYPISEAETVENLKLSGFDLVQRFTQILAYQGFMALKHESFQQKMAHKEMSHF